MTFFDIGYLRVVLSRHWLGFLWWRDRPLWELRAGFVELRWRVHNGY